MFTVKVQNLKITWVEIKSKVLLYIYKCIYILLIKIIIKINK
jgi:hypothetical protein